ncbi:hypothetical protein NitYY0826_C1653 [Nitratiruptor sp. YY08-26]|uniref:hypothetical protein n=1 Tax=unclassified Nitratiruptor TaxID=2624044 RepID=UPI001915C404|nr:MULTISPECIES: hypothetical protein [unclassified Nitratiruptor]BCD62770.1 hypothetical protein NitYY0813_C1651 [Nitratiruptor sp. YY08-13]BCD66706.1 hypothetical protein NitYY0826_C1653 [Nitratiruptor sp. YY08-26]
MKLAKLSLAAIVALGVSAFADVENVKFSGNAKLYYGTTDMDPNDLFDQKSSYGQAAATVAVTADLANGVAGKLSAVGLSTLGLENNLVSATWAGHAAGVDAQWWVNEAWLAKTFGNTTIKVGRQELDTPLAFSEKWNIAANSFDAAVVLNSDLPETTLVAAWVGRGNGAADGGVVQGVTNGTDPFNTYGTAIVNAYNGAVDANGAYAVAAITKLIPMTTAQVWYYSVVSIANAWWLQADVDLKDAVPGLKAGLQYAYIDPQGHISSLDESSAWAIKLGYGMDNGLKLCAAYSSTDEDGVIPIANTATGASDNSQSKLYTEAWWNYGYVGQPDTDAFMLRAAYNMEDVADLMAQYTSTSNDTTNVDMNEFAVTASKSFGNLDATLAYIYTDADDQNGADSYNTIQVYLTYNF